MSEQNCVFCDQSQHQKRLIFENDKFFVLPSLGQITDGGYVLLVPKKHELCFGAMQNDKHFDSIIAMFRDTIAKEYKSSSVVIFEHGIVGQTVYHAHLHFLPITCQITARIHNYFPKSEIEIISSFDDLQCRYAEMHAPYLLWSDADNKLVVCWDPPAPPQYLRTVLACAVGRPERANWRTMDRELDNRLINDTVRRLTPYL